MYMTAKDIEVGRIVNAMSAMSNEEICAYLVKCKGYLMQPEWIDMYR